MCSDLPCIHPRRRRRTRAGFSFIEVMVVIVIIGLLAGAVAIKVGDYIDKAKINRARSDIATIVNAVESFYADRGRYPGNDQGLSVLPLKGVIDPWGRSYVYNAPGVRSPFEVLCYGADGLEGGEGASADISSDDLHEAQRFE
jgi:general secretion pathway protein G